MAYPNINGDPETLKLKIRVDQIKELQYRTERHDQEKKIKSLKFHNEFFLKKHKSLRKRKFY